MDSRQIDLTAQIMLKSKAIVILTGAGVSRESGIPTYREPLTGMWAKYNLEELGTPQGFFKNPKLVWTWNEERRHLMREAEPNPGHYAIAELQRLLPDVTLVTQNIDGLHQKAGSTDVIELHGSIHRHKCCRNCRGNPTRVNPESIVRRSLEGVPVCPYCSAFVRPDIVWFHERIPHEMFHKARQHIDTADLLFTVGTSGLVWPAAGFPERAKAHNAYVIDINPNREAFTKYVDLHLSGTSGAILPALAQALRKQMSA